MNNIKGLCTWTFTRNLLEDFAMVEELCSKFSSRVVFLSPRSVEPRSTVFYTVYETVCSLRWRTAVDIWTEEVQTMLTLYAEEDLQQQLRMTKFMLGYLLNIDSTVK